MTAWASGPAELGYGDAPATTVSYGSNAADKYETTYFRRSFTVSDASRYRGYALNVERDDGVIVYLNGIEIYRDRPREDWTWRGDEVEMGTVALDLHDVIEASAGEPDVRPRVAAGTTIALKAITSNSEWKSISRPVPSRRPAHSGCHRRRPAVG